MTAGGVETPVEATGDGVAGGGVAELYPADRVTPCCAAQD